MALDAPRDPYATDEEIEARQSRGRTGLEPWSPSGQPFLYLLKTPTPLCFPGIVPSVRRGSQVPLPFLEIRMQSVQSNSQVGAAQALLALGLCSWGKDSDTPPHPRPLEFLLGTGPQSSCFAFISFKSHRIMPMLQLRTPKLSMVWPWFRLHSRTRREDEAVRSRSFQGSSLQGFIET